MHPQRTQLKRFKIKDKTLNQLIKYAVRKWYGQIYVEITYISKLVWTTRFRNDLHQVRSRSNNLKSYGGKKIKRMVKFG
jgi:hypothetical protein